MKKKLLTLLVFALLGGLGVSGCKTMDFIKADVLFTQEKYKEVIPLLEAYVAENPESVRERSKLGFAYLKTGRIDDAITTFEKTLVIVPGEPYSTLYLGLAYLNKEEYDKAIATWQGYKDTERPLVEAEVKRLTTLVLIAESQRAAKAAIANEKKMRARTLDDTSIAVCYYKDLSPNEELRGFEKGLSAMVISDLSKIKSLTVVERIRMQALLQEMKLGQTGIVDPKTAPQIGRLIGAENLVVGTLSGEILVATTLASTNTRSIKGTATVTIDKASFFEIPKSIVLDTAKIMRIKLTAEEISAIGKPHTKSYGAAIHYGMALDAMDAGNWENAQNLFAQALQADPQFELAKRGLEGCPGAGSASMGQLADMTSSQLAGMAGGAIATAMDSQGEADIEAEEAAAGGGGGGGGH